MEHWHLIDYVVVRKRDRQDVRVTKSMCGADCWTDHRLIDNKFNIRVQPKRRPQGKKAPKRLNITQPKNTNTKQCFVDILEVRLESTPLDSQNVEADWATLRELVYNTATEILGPRPESTRTGLTKTATRSSSYWMRNTVSIKPTSVAPSPPRRKMHTTPYA